ncbi:MAG TPA: hypothetical protein VHH55_01910 [Gaiellaceae bacterium]|nr:hypothetical protein [Gaiellaceae bacterium]
MDVERYGDPGDFLAHAHDFLIAREAEHNVILGLPDRLRARPTL